MTTGYVLGTAGGSLDELTSGAAEVGRAGEVRTGQVLDAIAHGSNRVVLHDLDVPDPRIKANIDHLVVGEDVVLIVDSKVWKPGIYWTMADASYRGLENFPYGDKQTMSMIQEKLGDHLPGYRIRRPLVAVWCSKPEARCRTFLLKMPGANVAPAASLERRVRSLVPDAPPADGLIDLLEPLRRDRPERRRVQVA